MQPHPLVIEARVVEIMAHGSCDEDSDLKLGERGLEVAQVDHPVHLCVCVCTCVCVCVCVRERERECVCMYLTKKRDMFGKYLSVTKHISGNPCHFN